MLTHISKSRRVKLGQHLFIKMRFVSFSYSVYTYVRMYEKACVLLSTIDCYCKINHF